MEIAEPNWARGFRQGWEVAEEYEIIAGVLRMKGAIRRVYSPMMHPEIPWKLAKLRRGDEAGLLEFARTYGRLGYSNLVEPERRRGGDPLPWIWLHVETLQMCMNLLYFLQEKDEERDVDRLAGYLRSLCGPFPFPVDHEHWPAAIVAERGTSRAHFWRFPATPKQLAYSAYYDVQEIEGLAQKICIDVVNANVGVATELGNVKGKIRWFFHFQALIEAAYWHLGNAMQAGSIERCIAEDCGALFIQTHGRQKHCPPPFGQGKSRCANRARQRRCRQKR